MNGNVLVLLLVLIVVQKNLLLVHVLIEILLGKVLGLNDEVLRVGSLILHLDPKT